MPRLQVEIGGTTAGLGQAANQALGILENLKNVAGELKLELFKATDVFSLNAVGNTLANVTGQIREYTSAAIQGSKAFQDQQTTAILDALNTKLTVLTGSAQLFGDSIKNQQSQVRAYEAALNKLLANGLTPVDSKVISLKNSIDSLNSSITAASAGPVVNLNAQYQNTGRIIPDLEAKIKRLKTAIEGATDTRSLALYNNRLRTAQDELERLRRLGIVTGNTLTNSANTAANAARRLSGGYNAVGLEFGRIIQDAPFAANNFGAIGNNITRLVEVLPGYAAQLRAGIIAQGGVATSAAVAKAGLLGLVTGFGGVTIAISALVAGYTFYQQRQQAAARAEKETTTATGQLREQLQNLTKDLLSVSDARYKGVLASADEIAKLQQLYSATQDSNIPLKERKRIVDELQKQHPTTFGNLSDEVILAGKAEDAYKKLNAQLIGKAVIQANVANLGKALGPLLAAGEAAAKTAREIEAAQKILSDPLNYGIKEIEAAKKTLKTLKLGEIFKEANKNSATEIKKTITDILKAGNDVIKDLGADVIIDETKVKKAKKGPADRSDRIVATSDRSLALSGLTGTDQDVENVRQKYIKLYNDLSLNAKKSAAGRKTYEEDLATLQKNEAGEISGIVISERQRVADEISRIETESGIKSSESRARELQAIELWYDKEVKKARDSQELIDAAGEGRTARITAVNEKYTKIEEDLQFKIAQIRDKAEAVAGGRDEKATEKIRLEWEKRKKEALEYYDLLIKLAESDPTLSGAERTAKVNSLINAKSTVSNSIDKASSTDISAYLNKDFAADIKRVTSGFINDLYTGFSTLNQQADRTFGTIVSSLASKINTTITGIVVDRLQKELGEKLAKGIEDGTAGTGKLLGTELKTAIAGLAIAGGLISGVTKKTSSVGQGLGGALSGAATGAALGSVVPGIGTAVGAAVGGVIGALGGLFGAGKARKEEQRIAEEQLAEAKRQTDLLRQNALAYTSSIVGRMTDQGILTNVDVNGFGQLTAKVSGKDISFVLDRNSNTR